MTKKEDMVQLGIDTEETLNLAKSITTSDNLYGYNLEDVAKKLYFVEDTVASRTPRTLNTKGGNACHWKAITGINTTGITPGVSEGNVNSALTISTEEKYATYKTLNMYQTYSDEAVIYGRNFADIPATGMLTTLQALKQAEDLVMIGGNITALGKPSSVTATEDNTATSISAGSYVVKVSAVNIFGWQYGAEGQVSSTDADGETDAKGATSLSLNANKAIKATWAEVKGACGYNVYVNDHFQFFTPVNTALITEVGIDGNAPNTADQTANANIFDGILAQLSATGSGAYWNSLAGATLTSNNAGGIKEIEAMLKSIYKKHKTSPTYMLVSPDLLQEITTLAVGNAGTNPTRITISADGKNAFTAGSAVTAYWNPLTQQNIEIISTVHCPEGMIIAVGENVPYPQSEVANNIVMDVNEEYKGELLARTKRETPVSVTVNEALKVYLPGACGVITNVA